MDKLRAIYVKFRSPRIFLIALSAFVITSLVLHYLRGYDRDWGGTNLSLSIEASVASAVITVAADETIKLLRKILGIVERQEQILARLDESDRVQAQTLHGVLLIAEALRDELQEKQNARTRRQRKSAV
jgi:hypothetical protein